MGSAPPEPSTTLLREATAPAFAELRNIVTGLTSYLAATRVIAVELDRPLAALAAIAHGQMSPRDLLSDPQLIEDAVSCREDLHDLVGSLATTIARMQKTVSSLEHGLDATGATRCRLGDTLEIAATIADHATRRIGGVHWPTVPPHLQLGAPRFATSLCIALVLRVLAEPLRGVSSGIRGEVEHDDDTVTLRLSVEDAPPQCYERTVTVVGPTVEEATLLALSSGPRGVRLRWTRAYDD